MKKTDFELFVKDVDALLLAMKLLEDAKNDYRHCLTEEMARNLHHAAMHVALCRDRVRRSMAPMYLAIAEVTPKLE